MSELRSPVTFLRLAWQNVRRNTRRTLLTATAVLVAVMALTFMQAYIQGMLDDVLDTIARTQSGHVRIRRAGYTERERFQPLYLYVPYLSEILPVVRTHPSVSAAAPRIQSGVLVDTGSKNTGALVMGVDLEAEEAFLQPSRMLTEGRLPDPGRPEVLAGSRLADELEVSVGDTLTLLGQTVYRSFGGLRVVISGIGRSGIGFLDRTLLLMPIQQARIMTDMSDGATEILMLVDDPEEAHAVAALLDQELAGLVEGGLETTSWEEGEGIVQALEYADMVWGFMDFLLLLMAGLVIVNTMLMSVMERSREIGMLGAMGMRRREIVTLILTEALVIGAMGALVGGALGSGVALWLEQTGMDFSAALNDLDFPMRGIVYPDWNFLQVAGAIGLGLLASVIAALYPALKAVRMQPAEALRG